MPSIARGENTAANGQAVTFFARPETRQKLEDSARPKVILIGSFSGPKNFGDMLQLRAALRWHETRERGLVICPLHNLARAWPPEHLQQLARVFGTNDWLFCDKSSDSTYAVALGLQRLTVGIRGRCTLHVYGGGFFNSLWGQRTLARIEATLDEMVPEHYIISGQQVGQEFAATLATHCRSYQPDIIGCRDEESVAILRQHGLDVQFSGDDAFEELVEAASGPLPPPADRAQGEENTRPYALYLNSSNYVVSAPTTRTALEAIENCIGLLMQHAGSGAPPLLIEAYCDDNSLIQDTLATIKKTRFATALSASTRLDLVDCFERNCLNEAAAMLRRCQLAVSTSYHVTLFLKILGVPVYFLSFNDYYRQKKQGLGDTQASLEEFLRAPRLPAETTDASLSRHLAARVSWFDQLDAVLAAPPQDARLLARALASLEHLRQQRSGARVSPSPSLWRKLTAWLQRGSK